MMLDRLPQSPEGLNVQPFLGFWFCSSCTSVSTSVSFLLLFFCSIQTQRQFRFQMEAGVLHQPRPQSLPLQTVAAIDAFPNGRRWACRAIGAGPRSAAALFINHNQSGAVTSIFLVNYCEGQVARLSHQSGGKIRGVLCAGTSAAEKIVKKKKKI